jgi:hypothetical protein
MGLLDKLLGREKKDAGDMAGTASPHDEGMHQDEGMAEEAAPAMEEHSHDGTEQAPEHEH